jgi:diguanylate cyclase (GGDEF)-like protein
LGRRHSECAQSFGRRAFLCPRVAEIGAAFGVLSFCTEKCEAAGKTLRTVLETMVRQGVKQSLTENQPATTDGAEVSLSEARRAELRSLAQQSGLAVVVLQRGQPGGEFAAQDNSLCQFFQQQHDWAAACARDCSPPEEADDAPFRCHAGLYVVRAPLKEGRAAVVGGRALLAGADYKALRERFNQGDLAENFTLDTLGSLIWATPQKLGELGKKLRRWAAQDEFKDAPLAENTPAEAPPAETAAPPRVTMETRVAVEENAAQTPPETAPPMAVSPAQDFRSTAQAALKTLAEAENLTDAAILWRSGERFEIIGGVGLWQDSKDRVVCDLDDAFLVRAAESKGSVRVSRAHGVWDFVSGLKKGQKAQNEAEIFPFLVGETLQGAFLVVRDALTNDTRRAVAEFGRQLGGVLESQPPARAETAVTVRDYPSEFAQVIGAAEAADPYSPLLEYLAQLLRAARASLMVYDEDSGTLVLQSGIGLPIPLTPELRVALNEGVAGKVLLSGRPLLVRDLMDAGLPPSPRERGYRAASFLSYPLRRGPEYCGVINFTERSDGTLFSAQEVAVLDALSPQLTLALERAAWRDKAMRFQQMSITDPLTGLANRRYLMARLAEETSRALRHNSPCSFMMLDLDDFKRYNDQHGHLAGDEALMTLARALRSTLRAVDVAARFGGEEFSVLLPQTGLSEARAIAQRLRQRIAGTTLPHGAVTVSVGVADFSPRRTTPEAIIKAADEALYEAKARGKNNVVICDDER